MCTPGVDMVEKFGRLFLGFHFHYCSAFDCLLGSGAKIAKRVSCIIYSLHGLDISLT
jgi:hypothetical protein